MILMSEKMMSQNKLYKIKLVPYNKPLFLFSSNFCYFQYVAIMRLREWWWRRKEEQRDVAVGCEMWICMCVRYIYSVGLSCQGRWFSLDPVESWRGASSYVGS
jgi:hypothetical protein